MADDHPEIPDLNAIYYIESGRGHKVLGKIFEERVMLNAHDEFWFHRIYQDGHPTDSYYMVGDADAFDDFLTENNLLADVDGPAIVFRRADFSTHPPNCNYDIHIPVPPLMQSFSATIGDITSNLIHTLLDIFGFSNSDILRFRQRIVKGENDQVEEVIVSFGDMDRILISKVFVFVNGRLWKENYSDSCVMLPYWGKSTENVQ